MTLYLRHPAGLSMSLPQNITLHFLPGRRRLHAALAFLCLYLGLAASTMPGWANDKMLQAWRAEVKRTRILAENDVPRAYADAQRLLATLPGDAVPTDRIGALNLLARTEIYFSRTEQAARTIQLATDLAVQYADPVGQVEADLNLGLNAINQEASEMAAQAARENASSRMVELARRYEAESKQRQINELNLYNQQQRIELAQRALQQRWLWTVLLGSVATLLGAIYFLYRLRRSQSDLAKQTHMLQSILDSMGEGVAVVGAQGDMLLVNPAGKKIIGYDMVSADQRSSAEHLGLYLPDQLTRYPGDTLPLMRAIRGESCDNVEIFLRNAVRPEGRWLSVTARPLTGRDGITHGGVAVFTDITADKQAESLLQKSEQKFRTLAENSPDILIRYDRDCRCLYVNPTYAREVGWSIEDALRLPLEKRWRGRNIPLAEYRAILLRVMETQTPIEILVEWERPVDDELSVYAFHIVAECSDGQVIGALGMGHNITALKKAERQQEESLALLRNLESRRETVREEERRHIAREIHDELGQQLTAMRMKMAVLRLQFGTDNPELVRQVRDMQALVDNTIQTVRTVASSLRPAALDMGLAAALDWLVADFQQNFGISCQLQLPKEEVLLNDERATEVFRVVQESLTNVARHAGASRVDVAVERSAEAYLIMVRDDGCGFSPASTRKSALGLVGMRERGFALGGEVTISSTPGAGTTVNMRLPLYEERLVT